MNFAILTAPRFNKRRYRENIVSQELYKEWKATTGYKIDFKTFKEIWVAIADKFTDKVIEERDGVRLGNGLGDIYIATVPRPKTRAVDYKTSKALGKCVYHENWNTSGKIGKIIYATGNKKYSYRLSGYWGFRAHTLFKKKCKDALIQNSERYKNTLERTFHKRKRTNSNGNNNNKG